MAWKSIDRQTDPIPEDAGTILGTEARAKIRGFLDRYEDKRGALIPSLHVAQETAGHLSLQVMKEVAECLGINPSDVLDTTSFYTHFWTHARGKKVIVCCRSITCQMMGGDKVLEAIKKELGIDEHETTPDGKYSLITEECLAGCDHAPCMLINEKLHERVKPEDVPRILADPDNDKLDVPRSYLYDGVGPEEK
ncbi:MAG: NAD(P)H-dependent oxidoreductase subunit E [Phycisphaerae bacterium]|nr:NAD(P)H-dependent oxidoreductase subunit E [Phycisphaerae bacterium]